MKLPRFHADPLPSVRFLLVLGIAALSASPAWAATFGFTVNVDCYDSDVDTAGTNDTVFVEAWGDGELILRSSAEPNCGALNDWGTKLEGLSKNQVDSIEEIRLVASGGDAFWMDEIYIDSWVVTKSIGEVFESSDWPDLKDTCQKSNGDVSGECHWGRDGGKGWCISTDSDDGHGKMWDYIDHDVGCQPCFKYNFDGNGYTCN